MGPLVTATVRSTDVAPAPLEGDDLVASQAPAATTITRGTTTRGRINLRRHAVMARWRPPLHSASLGSSGPAARGAESRVVAIDHCPPVASGGAKRRPNPPTPCS